MSEQKNVLGGSLQGCSTFPMTGFYRDGHCRCSVDDPGQHTICVQMTDEFLVFSKEAGNDLLTPMPQYDFPGLIAGDRWCVCALRWYQAYKHGVVAPVVLEATHESILEIISLNELKACAVKYEQNPLID